MAGLPSRVSVPTCPEESLQEDAGTGAMVADGGMGDETGERVGVRVTAAAGGYAPAHAWALMKDAAGRWPPEKQPFV